MSQQEDAGGASESLIDATAAAEGRVVSLSRQLTGRDVLTFRIPKPQDAAWFQRACVPLFVRHLADPHAQEYGVSGHDQSGIDIISRRGGGDLARRVGVQCKHVKRLTKAHIRDDTAAALKIDPPLSEIIFATTDDSDPKVISYADQLEAEIRASGRDIQICVYDWQKIESLVVEYPHLHALFDPRVVASDRPESLEAAEAAIESGLGSVAKVSAYITVVREHGDNSSAEDPALHARIDAYRDLFAKDGQPRLALQKLLELLDTTDLSNRPWARFRIETNLASVALDLGDEPEAARRYDLAHSIRPGDPKALSNLAIARLIQGRHDEAMNFARAALAGTPRADDAVAYLLQAAAKSDWEGDPETLIPDDLKGTLAANVGLANFLWRRSAEGWEDRCRHLAQAHPEERELKRIGAHAVLSLMMREPFIGGQLPPTVTKEDLEIAAGDLKAIAERCLDIDFADRHDLIAYVSNAALLLRVLRRHAEAEALLNRGVAAGLDDPQIRRLLALTLIQLGKHGDAERLLREDADAENVLLRSELLTDEPKEALRIALGADMTGASDDLVRTRLKIVAEHALHAQDEYEFRKAVDALAVRPDGGTPAQILDVRWSRRTAEGRRDARDRLIAISEALPDDANLVVRFELAQALAQEDAPAEASRLLDGRVDTSRPSDILRFHLRQMASGRRDAEFRRLLAEADPEVRADRDVRWTSAVHAWNTGHLQVALDDLEAILAASHDHAPSIAMRLEILLRQGRADDVSSELAKPLETLPWPKLKDMCRIAALLGHFGYPERATAFAYRIYLEHRDQKDAWLLLNSMVMVQGRLPTDDEPSSDQDAEDGSHLQPIIVDADSAVDLTYDDGGTEFLVVEPDPGLRRIDQDAREPDNAAVKAILGLAVGDPFVLPDGRSGKVSRIRHKHLARAHDILLNFERRFPTQFGIKQVKVDFESENGLDDLIAQAKARSDFAEQQIETYLKTSIPLAFLARLLRSDVIDVAIGLGESGRPIKVSNNQIGDLKDVSDAIVANGRKGCVLDLLAVWTAWRLDVLDVVAETAGPVCVPRTVLDRLFERREHLREGARFGQSTMGYVNGKLSLSQSPRDRMAHLLEDLEGLIAWLEAHAEIAVAALDDTLPRDFRNLVLKGSSDEFDALILARRKDVLLVCDDLPTRVIFKDTGGARTAWLHAVLCEAHRLGHLSLERHARITADLVEAGQSDLSVTTGMLLEAAFLDAADADAKRSLFDVLVRRLGGEWADPRSHCTVAFECLLAIWRDPDTMRWRERRSGQILWNLIRDRRDGAMLLAAIRQGARRSAGLASYVDAWLRGHFIRSDVETFMRRSAT